MSNAFVAIGGHQVRVLRNGREAFPAMLDALDSASHAVSVEMYWWQPDATGLRFREALVAAARRGVRVAVVVDGFGSLALPKGFWTSLTKEGGRTKTFRPLRAALAEPSLRALVARDHRKIVVADGRAFVGGLNFAAQWDPVGEGGEDWRDTAVEIHGDRAAKHLHQLVEERTDDPVPRRPQRPVETVAWVEPSTLAIFSNAPANRRSRRIRQAYLWALRNARSSIDITCAYFAPRPLFLRALAAAARRGVRVRVLVPLRSDVEFARQASLPLLRWLTRHGVDVFAYGGAVLHAKTAVVDAEWCTVGSHNLDGLSWAWNLECNAVARSPGLAAQLTRMFEEDLCLAVRWPGTRSGLVERLFPEALRRWYSRG